MIRRPAAWMAAVAIAVACGGKLLTIRVEEESEVLIEKGTPLESLLSDLGFDGFTDMDITSRQAIENQGVEPGDITDVYFEELVLSVGEPEGGDLSFIDELSFYVEAEGLDRVRVATQDSFPEGQAVVEMELDDVDIVDYVVSESMDVTTEASGGRPDEDTLVVGSFVLSVGATAQGACNQAKKR